MRNRQELTETFNSMLGRYTVLCGEVGYSLKQGIDVAGVKIHSVSSRPKALESFLGKVDRKKYTEPFAQCEDLAAARVVCLFMSDLDRIRTVIESLFQVISRQDKVQDGDAATFGYMSQHYKNEDSVPQDVIRDFHAMSGLLYVADRQFETLARASSQYAASAENDIVHSGQAVSEINADTVAALLLKLFRDREASDAYDISDFVHEVISFGYRDLGILSADIEAGLAAALEDELEDPPIAQPGETDDGLYSRVGLARMSLKHSKPEYYEMMRDKWDFMNL